MAEGFDFESYMMQIMHIILQNDGNVNHAHSKTGITALMVAAAKGASVERLLRLGADSSQQAPNG